MIDLTDKYNKMDCHEGAIYVRASEEDGAWMLFCVECGNSKLLLKEDTKDVSNENE